LYESTSDGNITLNTISFPSEYVLDEMALAIMPTEWINELHFAAVQGNDMSSLHLIAQIPSEQTSLIAALTGLIESYQFDKLMLLTQPRK
jgi:hypothetical protein